tara:strand:+ start:124 stop:342 length:219 start_codon:yes stop_codon:yes gene_type:complete
MNDINNVLTKLKKINDKYPLFVECWIKFLKMRETSFLKSIESCENAIELIKKNKNDLTPETIGLVLILINQI